MDDLEALLRKAEKAADEAEVFFGESHGYEAETAGKYVENVSYDRGRGYGLRLIKKKRIGFSYFNHPKDFPKCLKTALRIAKFGPRTSASFPAPGKVPSELDYVDGKILDLDEKQVQEYAYELVGGVKKAKPLKGFVSTGFSKIVVANTSGLFLEKKQTEAAANISSIYKSSTVEEFDASRRLDVDFGFLGEKSGELARLAYNPLPFSGKTSLVFSPTAVSQLFTSLFFPSLDGERVFRGASVLGKKLGKKLSGFSLIEDPFLENGSASAVFDDEGVLCVKKNILDKGVLRSFLYDLRSAALAGVGSTGNGFRSSFKSQPSVGATNIVFDGPQRDVLGETRGVLIRGIMGLHTANPVTGDFSAVADPAFLLDKGELKESVKATFSGNFFDLLKKMELGKDYRRVGSFFSPSVYCGEAKLFS